VVDIFEIQRYRYKGKVGKLGSWKVRKLESSKVETLKR